MKYDRNKALLETDMDGIPPPKRGKVRDIYDLGDSLLFVATDRISAFDVVMPNGIPDKGRVLTGLSLFWFDLMEWMPNHLITADVSKYPEKLKKYSKDLKGRSMLVKKAKPLAVECIVRGYITGSGQTGRDESLPLLRGAIPRRPRRGFRFGKAQGRTAQRQRLAQALPGLPPGGLPAEKRVEGMHVSPQPSRR